MVNGVAWHPGSRMRKIPSRRGCLYNRDMAVKLPLHSSQAHDIPHAADYAAGFREHFDFHEASEKAAHDERLKKSVNFAVLKQYVARQEMMASLPNAEALRTLAGEIK